MRRAIVLGSTGSIGRAVLEVAEALRDEIQVVGLAAGKGWELLAEQAQRWPSAAVAIAERRHAPDLRRECGASRRLFEGPEGLVQLVRECDADYVVSAIVGAAGLPATLAAVERGLDIGIANKESLVVAGALLMPLAAQRGSKLIPVDSEHSAIFQCLQAGARAEVRRVFLTASGGPFRNWDPGRIARASLSEALNHPTWAMGPKITIDSATMMNKALEVIEAHWLFGLPVRKIEVVIHPESIVHSMVEFCDGSLLAQLGTPDMKTPIQYALTWPKRGPAPAESLSWSEPRSLHFEPPDLERFPALRLGYVAAEAGGTAGAALNAANEAAVEAFRSGRIAFGRIAELTQRVLHEHAFVAAPCLEELLAADRWSRTRIAELIGSEPA